MDEFQQRVEATRRALEARCREAEVFITGDGRISEQDAAALLGVASGTLKNQRGEGVGPTAYRVAIRGARMSYRLDDLARWIEVGRE